MDKVSHPFISSNERYWLAGSILVIILSAVLSTTTEVVSFFGLAIPPLCPFRWVTGVDCLGCGLTRSFVFMGHGDLGTAFEVHKLGPLLYLAVLIQLPLRIYRLWRHRHYMAKTKQVL